MSNTKREKKRKKQLSRQPIHYVQLRTHRQWPNELNYVSHLQVYHSKIQSLTYDIDRILNNKWIQLRQPQLINQLNESFQYEVKSYFLYKVN